MKVRALLIVSLLALSPVSYGYGDALFHVFLKNAMTDSRMVTAAPKADEPTSLSAGGAAVGFGVSVDHTVVVPEVAAPVVTTSLPCTSAASLAVDRGITDPAILSTMDHTCR